MPVPAAVSVPPPIALELPTQEETAVEHEADVPLPAPVFTPTATSDGAPIQRAVVEALVAAKQSSAADAMSDATWTITADEARVQTELSKTMLPVVINPEAEKITRAALREVAGALKLILLAGAGKSNNAKKPKTARAGSAQAKALEHPMVQEAQKLFGAEIQRRHRSIRIDRSE